MTPLYTLYQKDGKRKKRKKPGSFEIEVHSNRGKQAGKETTTWGIAVRMGATLYSIEKKQKMKKEKNPGSLEVENHTR